MEVGIDGDKRIVIPSFGTTSALFTRHFEVLRKLKRQILLLKQSYIDQADFDRAWEHVDKILEVLDKGCEFLTVDDDDIFMSLESQASSVNDEDSNCSKYKPYFKNMTLRDDKALDGEEDKLKNQIVQETEEKEFLSYDD